jgi:porphobilinogen deaminase
VGQATGLIKDMPKVSEVIERIVAEAEEVQKRMALMMSSTEDSPALGEKASSRDLGTSSVRRHAEAGR